MIFLDIFVNNIVPLFAFLAAGWYLDWRFPIDLKTYSVLTSRVVLPGFIFYAMYLYQPNGSEFFLLAAAAALLVVTSLTGGVMARALGFSGDKAKAFRAVSAFSNSGQLGIAIILMVYSHAPFVVNGETPWLDEARGVIILLLIFMNTAVNIFGASAIGMKSYTPLEMVKFIFQIPAVYAVIAAALIRGTGFPLESTFLWPVLRHFPGGFILMVMVTSGIRLRRERFALPDSFDIAAAVNKLILSPIFAWGIITLSGVFPPVAAQVFFIYAAVPSAFSLIIYAIDYRNHPGRIARAVTYSSVFGAVTLTVAIRLAEYFFPAGV